MDHSEFDKEMIEKLGDTQDFAFDENQWDRLEAELDKKKEKRRPIAWWFWGAAASFILLLGIGYYSFILNQKIDVLEKKIATFSKIEEIKNTNTATLKGIDEDVELNVNADEIFNTPKLDNNKSQNNKTSSKQLIIRKKAEISIAAIKANDEIHFIKAEQKNIAVDDILLDRKNALEPLIVLDENQATQTVNVAEESATELIAENWKNIAALENKEETLAALDYPMFRPAELAISHPFRLKNISIGAFGNAGWKVASSSSFEFNSNKNPENIIADPSFDLNYFDNSSEATDVEVWQYGLKSRIQFTHGWGLNFSLGKKIFSTAESVSRYANQIATPTTNDFFNSIYDVISFKNTTQKQWVLGTGISYSPFWKWKVRPFIQVTPEFSWAVKLNKIYQIEERSSFGDNPQIAPIVAGGSYYERSLAISVDKFKLRNVNMELGVEGMIGKHFQWQATIGINTALNVSSQYFLNRYQTGAGLNYIF